MRGGKDEVTPRGGVSGGLHSKESCKADPNRCRGRLRSVAAWGMKRMRPREVEVQGVRSG